MANIKSLSDLKKEDQTKKKKKKDLVSHYTGGQNSGLAVEGSAGSGDSKFPEVLNMKLPENCQKITLYKNGFTLDDGEFRDLSIEENKKFMKDIEAGFLPPELAAKGKYVSVALNDKSHVTYTPPEPKEEVPVYQGAGKKLGNGGAADISEEDLNKMKSLPQNITQVEVDMNKPYTNLQIRLYNGKRIEQKFNHDHTVEDLYTSIYNVTPVNFALLYDFPLKVIPKSSLTLEEAKIVDAVITQKIV